MTTDDLAAEASAIPRPTPGECGWMAYIAELSAVLDSLEAAVAYGAEQDQP